jgi:hypothetical protein
MLDDLERLRTKSNLRRLLTHYLQLGEPDRTAWQDRLMAMDGFERQELSKLHGELIAFGWIEQNTGNLTVLRAGAVADCYRVTLAGLRAVRQIHAPEADGEPEAIAPPIDEKPVPKRTRRKRGRSREQEVVASSV